MPRLIRLPELLRAADAATRDNNDDFDAVKALLAAGTGSLGGARPEAAMLDEGGRQLIARFPHPEGAWDVMAGEATALDLAAAAGVRVARHRLVRVGGRRALLLDRFDRNDDHCIGYVSAMTMLEYRDGGHADYVDVADRLAKISAQATDDAQQLFRRVAVSVGLNNTDVHLRNHAFLRARGGWALSPAFDVNPDPAPELLQTTIAGADVPADEANGLIELARACRLSPAHPWAILADGADALVGWTEVANGNNVPTHSSHASRTHSPRGFALSAKPRSGAWLCDARRSKHNVGQPAPKRTSEALLGFIQQLSTPPARRGLLQGS